MYDCIIYYFIFKQKTNKLLPLLVLSQIFYLNHFLCN